MAASTNRDHFFQTTASNIDYERKQRKAANTFGSPVKFPTKLLAVHSCHPNDDVVFTAQAGGTLSAIKLSTNQVSSIGKAASAPITCIASTKSIPNATATTQNIDLLAGCWNKSIIKFELESSASTVDGPSLVAQTAFAAHNDFVKCLAIAPTADKQQILVSGGADGELKFWSLQGTCLTTVRPNCRSIESVVLDPYSSPDAPVVFFSTSQREIFQAIVPTFADLSSGKGVQMSSPIVAHETSVYKITFDESDDGDLWTASADKTAKCLSRVGNWTPETTLAHPDFVRDVVIVHSRTKLVVTACRDEEIRVWNASTAALLHIFSGHYEEVTGLAVVTGDLLLSVSIDATMRRWSLEPGSLQAEIEKAKKPDLLEDNSEPKTDELAMLTAEEEAELRALMEDEEADGLEKMAQDNQ